MASNSRRQIESWLGTLAIEGSVIDVGGLFMPIKGRTQMWDVSKYDIIDIKKTRNGIEAKYVADLNYPYSTEEEYDNAFCIEVTDHFWNPVQAFQNINGFLKPGGLLYISSNFLFPHHTGFDCIRFTRDGLKRVLEETGFEVIKFYPRKALNDSLENALRFESKVVYYPSEIGYMVIARKNGLN
jgi:SAM-dependent methyltransferase